MNQPSKYTIGMVDFLKLLVLLYAALVPAGLWVRGEIKSSIRDAIDNGTLVTVKELNAREGALRADLMEQFTDGLGPIVSYIASVDSTLQHLVANPPKAPQPAKPIAPKKPDKGKEYIWRQPDEQQFPKPDEMNE